MIYNGIISGKYINLRSVLIEDADFTLKIRQNKKKTKFLHNVDDDIEKQRQWIKTQQQRLGDYFFIAENKIGEPMGTIGIYEIHNKKANFGRILMIGNAFYTYEASILLAQWAFDFLHLDELYGKVDVENKPSRNLCTSLGFCFDEPYYDEELKATVQIGHCKLKDFISCKRKLELMIYR